MKIKAEQLAKHLKPLQSPLFIISGDEPLLVQETLVAVRQAAHAADYTERLRFDADASFEWAQLPAFCQSVSLFCERRFIELHLPNTKLSKEAQKQLQQYAKQPSPDCLLVLVLPKLTAAQQKTKWFSNLEKAGIFVQIWPLFANQFPTWLKQRAQQHDLNLTSDALQLLAYLTTGNLLAAQQACEKLALTYGQQTIDITMIRDAVHDHGQFDLFQLSDAALQGDAPLVLRCWQQLQASGEEAQLVLWSLSRDLRFLQQLQQQQKIHGLWPQRQQLLQQALQRFSAKKIMLLLQFAGKIDRILKGAASGNAWDALLNLALRMASVKQLPRCVL